jgi:hypothetical protein
MDSGQCPILVPKRELGNQRNILVGGAHPHLIGFLNL